MTTDRERIPLAWPVRWRRVRRHLLPVACFLAAILLSGWLWEHRSEQRDIQGWGEVQGERVNVTSPATARVAALSNEAGHNWQAYDRLAAGDLLVRLEPLSSGENGEAISSTEITAPLSGTLVALHCAPRQVVTAGSLLATVAADAATHVIGYLPEISRLEVEPGQSVTLRTPTSPDERLESSVVSVGGQIELIPPHQSAGAGQPQWGLPVRIRLPQGSQFRPGTRVEVVFHGP